MRVDARLAIPAYRCCENKQICREGGKSAMTANLMVTAAVTAILAG